MPWVVVEYLSAQLGVVDPSIIKRYAERVATANAHAPEIRQLYGYQDVTGPVDDELAEFVYARAWTRGEGPTSLFEHEVDWLRRKRVLLPGMSRLAKMLLCLSSNR